ncbi:type VI secretion system baseplate subunit TssK [Prosthecobacter sp.]|uniref:type VI secretion system baseplate subunit TssK n=1 Tax=Prosthecobacter sp. TaxID=1965333 RepID=UPI00378374B5
MSFQVHWHEGLFLQPHHLQTLQRSMLLNVWGERRYSMAFSYGVIEASLAQDDLAAHRVKFDKLHVAMPDGLLFRFPEDAALPALDIRNAFEGNVTGITVGLSLPLWHASGRNTIDYQDSRSGKQDMVLYKVDEQEICDENTGKNPQPVQVRKLNGLLTISTDEASRQDVQFLPLLKIVRQVAGESAGHPRSDPAFVPASLLLCSSPPIFQLVRDLTSQICATREQLATQLAAAQLDLRLLQGGQFEQLSRLRCLSRSAALLPSLIDEYIGGCGGRVPPFEVYLALRDLLAELSSLYPARGLDDPLPYDHDSPWPPFADLDLKIRSFLGAITKVRHRKIDFHFDTQKRWFVGDLRPDFFQNATGYYLGIECSSLDPTSLGRLVEDPDHFKLMPASFGPRALRGLILQEERVAHADLPQKAGRFFFRINALDSDRIWDFFKREPEGIVKFESADYTKFRIALYATLPAGEG